MNPGRELDALIAEKVMGCKVDRRVIGGSTEDDFHCGCPRKTHETKEEYSELEHYSTDIAAAWEVVEAIKSLRPDPDKETNGRPQEFKVSYDNGKWTCGWYPYSWDGVPTLEAEADSAPHAICLAALRAIDDQPKYGSEHTKIRR